MKKIKKITLFCESLEGGGAERVMVSLANGFNRANISVDMVLVRKVGCYLDELDKGINVVDLESKRTLFALFPLINYMRHAKPSIFLSTLNHINALCVFSRFLSMASIQLCVRQSTTSSVDIKHAGGFTQIILNLIYPKILKAADLVVAPSEGVANDLIAEYKQIRKHIRVIPNPLDISRLIMLANSPLEHNIGLPLQNPIIIAVGRLNHAKDYPTLINAFVKVREKFPAHLLILGEGETRKSLEQLIHSLSLQDNVSMPGFMENPFVYMKLASVFVLSSRYEGMPNTLLQALAIGTPSVATDCPSGPREILEGGRWGRLVPVGDVNAMALAIIDGLEGRIVKPPVELMRACYGIDRITQQYLDALLEQ